MTRPVLDKVYSLTLPVSAGYLLFSEEVLAKRIICLGGCPPLLGQLPLPIADAMAETAKKHLGVEGISAESLVSPLNELPSENFWSKIPPNVPFLPVVDGEIIPEILEVDTWARSPTLPGNKFIEAILVGDSKLDVSAAMKGLSCRLECADKLLVEHHGPHACGSQVWIRRGISSRRYQGLGGTS